jgi:hypothetical protein
MKLLFITPLFLVGFLLSGCSGQIHDDDPAGPGGWLTGDSQEKFDTIARQLGGFSAAMQEVGYRYTELYWAGSDGNWDYASYQAAKIGSAIRDGIERRPARAESASRFLEYSLPDMEEAIDSHDRDSFMRAFNSFTQSCNSCHESEDVSFITIGRPEDRGSPVRRND